MIRNVYNYFHANYNFHINNSCDGGLIKRPFNGS
jgi:hypothetical protein